MRSRLIDIAFCCCDTFKSCIINIVIIIIIDLFIGQFFYFAEKVTKFNLLLLIDIDGFLFDFVEKLFFFLRLRKT